jgi:hypothetical protein
MWIFKSNWSGEQVNTREIAEEYRLSHWAVIMRERAESGQSIRAFCASRSICYNVYFYWPRKLREAACQEQPVTSAFTDERKSKQSIIPSGWVVCAAVENERKTNSEVALKDEPLTIEIGKSRITVDASTDSALLEKVCRMLASLC